MKLHKFLSLERNTSLLNLHYVVTLGYDAQNECLLPG